MFFSPVVSGKGVDPVPGKPSLFPTDADFSWFPLENPGIISIPLGFLFGWLGTVTSKESTVEDKFTELEVRSFTGVGSEKATPMRGSSTPIRLRSHLRRPPPDHRRRIGVGPRTSRPYAALYQP